MEETTKCAALYQNSDHIIFYILSMRLMYLLQGLGNYMEDKKVDYAQYERVLFEISQNRSSLFFKTLDDIMTCSIH